MSLLSIGSMYCEYRKNPLGLDIYQPRLGWELKSDRRGVVQTAYRIRAGHSEAALAEYSNLLWDTGRVEADTSMHIRYAGAPLVSQQKVFWKVTVWDNFGNQADSETMWWEMGLLQTADWQARWIGAPFYGGPRTTSPAPYLRKEFALANPVAKARLYITALGLYECTLNGQRVGEDVFTPGWTDYKKRVQYQVYDVTSLLQSGDNAIGVTLGDGWAVGNVAWVGRQRSSERPVLLAQLVVTDSNGNTVLIPTDISWKVNTGPVLESDILMGESYDARREIPGWDRPNFDDSQWRAALALEHTSAQLVATNGPTVRRQEEVQPVSVVENREYTQSRWVIDMGQNMVGWVRIRVRGDAGETITLKYAEVLNPDGSLYTANLRTARNIDYYTLRGGAEEIWEPRFTFHGFRYVELSGYAGVVTAEMVTGIVVHSDTPVSGLFECSDPRINQLQHNILWGQKGNFVDVPTDCPQRDERLGWTGDAQVFIRTSAFNMNVAGFFTKWLNDLKDSQSPEGGYPAVAPNPGAWPTIDGGPAWADAGIICPWTIHLCYADLDLLAAQYDSMRAFIDFLIDTSRNNLRCYADYTGWHGFGDWLALDGSDGREGATSKELIATAFFAYSTGLFARISAKLGKYAEADRYYALAHDIRTAFCDRFVLPNGRLTVETQTGYILALHFNLLPETQRQAAVDALVEDIQRRGTHLSTGFVGTPYINWVLSENGHIATAYELLQQTTWPSWLYSVTQGATTIWERWDAWTHDKGFQNPGMNSFNHYAYGAIGAWMYAVIGGIDLDPDEPGYKHIRMCPKPGGGLTSARAELRTGFGLIRSAWTLEHEQFTWQITVPPNTRATISIPVSSSASIQEQGKPVEEVPGITFIRRESDVAVYRIASGDYLFTSKQP